MPIFIVFITVGALIGVQSASSAPTSRIAICNSNGVEVSEFYSTCNDKYLDIYAKLYVDDEWRILRDLTFDITDSEGNSLFHLERITSFTGYCGLGIYYEDLKKMDPGDYNVKVSYGGNEKKGWPPATSTAVIHHH